MATEPTTQTTPESPGTAGGTEPSSQTSQTDPSKSGPGNLLADLVADPKVEEPKSAEPDKPKEGTTAGETAPIDYKAELKLPDGVELNLDQFTQIAGDIKLPVDKAQALIDMHVSTIQEAGNALGQAWNEMQRQWQNEVQSDPEIGGNNLASTKVTIAKALDQYGTPGLRAALELTGAGNNPEVIRTFYKMARALTEGGHVKGEPNSNQPKTAAQAMYPDLPSAAT